MVLLVVPTPIGNLPRYEELAGLFDSIIDKPYPRSLYIQQFSLYIDNIVARIDLQIESYGKEERIPPRLFEVLNEQRRGLMALREAYGPVVEPAQLLEAAAK